MGKRKTARRPQVKSSTPPAVRPMRVGLSLVLAALLLSGIAIATVIGTRQPKPAWQIQITPYLPMEEGAQPYWPLFTVTNQLFMLVFQDWQTAELRTYSRAGNLTSVRIISGDVLEFRAICADARGNVYILNPSEQQIHVVWAESNEQGFFPLPDDLHFPDGIEWSPANVLVVSGAVMGEVSREIRETSISRVPWGEPQVEWKDAGELSIQLTENALDLTSPRISGERAATARFQSERMIGQLLNLYRAKAGNFYAVLITVDENSMARLEAHHISPVGRLLEKWDMGPLADNMVPPSLSTSISPNGGVYQMLASGDSPTEVTSVQIIEWAKGDDK